MFLPLLVSLLLPIATRASSDACPVNVCSVTTSADLLNLPATCFSTCSDLSCLSNFTGPLCSGFKSNQIRVLDDRDPLACTHLTSSCLNFLTHDSLSQISDTCVSSLTSDAVSGLDETRLHLLRWFSSLSSRNFDRVTRCGSLSKNDAASLSSSAGHPCSVVTPKCLRSMPRDSFSGFSAECVGEWSKEAVREGLTTAAVESLGDAVIGMSRGAAGGMGRACEGLGREQTRGLTERLGEGCSELGEECAGWMREESMAFVEPGCFGNLSGRFVKALTGEKMGAVSARSFARVSAAQAAALEAGQCSGLRGAQLAVIEDEGVCRALRPECLAAVTAAAAGKWTAKCASVWTDEQVWQLRARSISAMSAEAVSTWKAERLLRLVKKFGDALLGGLSPAHVAKLRAPEVRDEVSAMLRNGSLSRCHVVCKSNEAQLLVNRTPANWLQLMLSEDNLGCLSVRDVAAWAPDDLSLGMRCPQVSHLRPAALYASLANITDTNLPCVTRAHVEAMTPSFFRSIYTRWKFLSPEAASGVSPEHVQASYSLTWPCSVVTNLAKESMDALICEGEDPRSRQTLYSSCNVPSCPKRVGMTVLGWSAGAASLLAVAAIVAFLVRRRRRYAFVAAIEDDFGI